MGHKKKKHDNSSDSSESSSSGSDTPSVKDKKVDTDTSDEDTKKKVKKQKKRVSSSSSSSSEDEPEQKHKKHGKTVKEEPEKLVNIDKAKKPRYEEAQKSKWDSPAENLPKHNERKLEKDTRSKRYSDKDEGRDQRKYHDKPRYERPEKRESRDNYRRDDNRRNEDNRNENRRNQDDRNENRRNQEDRYNKDRGRYDRDRRPNEDRHRNDRNRRERSRSREDNRRDRREDFKSRGNKRPKRESSADHENYNWGKKTNEESNKKSQTEKDKPNFGLSGKLTEDTNTYRGVVIKYSEPTEARKPKRRWRLYPFKGEKALPTLFIHRESAYLMGRDRKIVDFPLDHPSCSKQHAVLQYRLVPFTRDDGSTGKRVRPYIIDLDSANGTFINNKRIEARKYVELLEKDVIKFGYSSREYVMLHENSKDEALDDDVKPEDEEIPEKPIKEEPQE